jgi:molecular chaperone GrpE
MSDQNRTDDEVEAAAQAQPGENEEWQSKAEVYLDQYRRCMAEFANYRKRQERDKEQLYASVTMDVLRQLLPIVDDLERGIENMPPEHSGTSWTEGVALIERKLKALLANFGCQPIEAVGRPFDPVYHSALLMEPSEQYPAQTVMEELQKGYMFSDRVLRPTTVKVSSGSPSSNS